MNRKKRGFKIHLVITNCSTQTYLQLQPDLNILYYQLIFNQLTLHFRIKSGEIKTRRFGHHCHHYQIEFFRGLKISGKIFSRRYELSRDSRESILGAVVCKFILLVFSGGDSLLFLFLSSWVANKKLVALFLLNWLLF